MPELRANSNRVMSTYIIRAAKRGYKFRLSEDEFEELTQGICQYCGSPPSNVRKGRDGDFYYNGIDRVNPNKGYIYENCVPCCSTCNFAKRSMSYADFIRWIRQVHEHLNL